MNRDIIERSASYKLLSEFLWIPKETIKNSFKKYKKNIKDPFDVAQYIDRRIENRAGVYVIECTKTGKKYIWESWNIWKRRADHRSSLQKGKHITIKMQEDYNIYWLDSFKYFIYKIENDRITRLEEEDRLISSYWWENVYNWSAMYATEWIVKNKDITCVILKYPEEVRMFLEGLSNKEEPIIS